METELAQPARLASLFVSGKRRYGLVREDGAVDISTRFQAKWPTLREAIVDDALARLAEAEVERRQVFCG
jgi:hypothetical protein